MYFLSKKELFQKIKSNTVWNKFGWSLGAGIANFLDATIKPLHLKYLWRSKSSLWTATLSRAVFFHSPSETKTEHKAFWKHVMARLISASCSCILSGKQYIFASLPPRNPKTMLTDEVVFSQQDAALASPRRLDLCGYLFHCKCDRNWAAINTRRSWIVYKRLTPKTG